MCRQAMTRHWGALLISVGQTSAVMVKDIVSVPGSGPSITQARCGQYLHYLHYLHIYTIYISKQCTNKPIISHTSWHPHTTHVTRHNMLYSIEYLHIDIHIHIPYSHILRHLWWFLLGLKLCVLHLSSDQNAFVFF